MADQPNSIFEDQNKQETPASNQEQNGSTANTAPTQTEQPFANLLGSILNEKGEPKYKSVEDALIGLKHAQEYIPKIKESASEKEQELNQLRQEVDRLKSLENTVLELTQKQEKASTNGVSLSEEDIAQLVESTLTKQQQAKIQQDNVTTVVSAVSQKFGADAEKVFYTKAQELGLSVEEMNALAARTPKAVLTLLGVSETTAHKQVNVSPTTGSVNTSAFQPNPESFLGRETTRVTIGATTDDLKQAVERSAALVDELQKQGLTTYDLTDPKVYFKHFK